MKATKVEIYCDKKKQFRWRARAKNGEVIASSEGYTRKADAQRGGHRAFPDAKVVDVC